MFDALGVKAMLGRTFTEADDVRGGGPDGPVAVVSYGFWTSRMGGAPDAIGRRLALNGLDVTVIGVTPRGFLGPDVGRSADIIVPVGAVSLIPGQARLIDGRSTWWLEIMGRLKPGQTSDEAAARLNAVRPQIRLATLPPDWPAKELEGYMTQPLKLVPAATGVSSLRSNYSRPLQIVLGLVGAVLVIACANLANLLLARAASRRHELSVRLRSAPHASGSRSSCSPKPRSSRPPAPVSAWSSRSGAARCSCASSPRRRAASRSTCRSTGA